MEHYGQTSDIRQTHLNLGYEGCPLYRNGNPQAARGVFTILNAGEKRKAKHGQETHQKSESVSAASRRTSPASIANVLALTSTVWEGPGGNYTRRSFRTMRWVQADPERAGQTQGAQSEKQHLESFQPSV